jgi:hypothetical protein
MRTDRIRPLVIGKQKQDVVFLIAVVGLSIFSFTARMRDKACRKNEQQAD